MHLSHPSTRVKLLLLFAIPLSGVTLFLILFLPSRIEGMTEQWMKNRALSLASVVANAVGPGLEAESPEQIQKTLETLETIPGVTYAAVRRQDGSPLASWKSYPAKDVVQKAAPHAATVEIWDNYMTVSSPVATADGNAGNILIAMSLDELEQAKKANWTMITLALVALWIVGLGLSGAAASIVTRRQEALAALKRTETGFTAVIEKSPEGIVVSRDGALIYANSTFAKMMGYDTQAELIGQQALDLIYPGDRSATLSMIGVLARSDQVSSLETERLLRKDGSILTCEVTRLVADFEGALSVVTIARDVTARINAQQALRRSEERYALAAQGANDGLWDWDLETSEVFYSPRWKAMLGLSRDDGRPTLDEWINRIHPEDLAGVKRQLSQHIEGGSPHFESEHRLRKEDGSYTWVLSRALAVRNTGGRVTRMAGSLTDISERKRVEEQLIRDALYDKLTRLPNRTLLMKRLSELLEETGCHSSQVFAVLFLDLDRFKVINDSLGHQIGDEFIVAVAHRLESGIRSSDLLARAGGIVARLGGDEFVVLLEDVRSKENAEKVAQRLQTELSRPLILSGREVFTTASIGIALSTIGYETAEEMLRDADTAMYRAKAAGRARQQVFDSEMHAEALKTLEVEADLRRALERDELRLFYQPIVHIKTGEVHGFEALIRWKHPVRGFISPLDFVPLAEETGLIHQIGQWVVLEACKQTYEWELSYPKAPPLTINVNVSPRQFEHPDFADQVDAILRQTRLPPSCLKIEVTESMLMSNPECSTQMLAQLRQRGVAICMDDFGTGYSSLSHLRQYPFDTLKIDQSFVCSMTTDLEHLEIVRAIIALAKSMELTVVAEGVETEDQMLQLRDLECDYAQGYLFSPPVEATVATEVISSCPRWKSRKIWNEPPKMSTMGGRSRPTLSLIR